MLVQTDYARGTWWGADARLSRDLPGRQTITVGGEFRDNIRQQQGGGYADQVLPGYVIDQSSRVAAVFLQDEVQLHRRVLVNVSARYDQYDGFNRVTPRAALIVRPSPGQAFKIYTAPRSGRPTPTN